MTRIPYNGIEYNLFIYHKACWLVATRLSEKVFGCVETLLLYSYMQL